MGNEKGSQTRPSVFSRAISSAHQGSSSALGEVLEACRAYLLFVATRNLEHDLRPKISPSDVVQETCVEAQRNFVQFDGTTKRELLGWLRGILKNRVRKAERRFRTAAKRQLGREIQLAGFTSVIAPNPNVPASASFPGRQIIADEDAARLAQALCGLPIDYQQVIQLRNWELRSFAEIGERMNRSSEAARSLWSRAVQRLTEELEPHDV